MTIDINKRWDVVTSTMVEHELVVDSIHLPKRVFLAKGAETIVRIAGVAGAGVDTISAMEQSLCKILNPTIEA